MELLVHISAPTSRKGDNIFVAQAEAYSDFQPVTVRRVEMRIQPVVLIDSPTEIVPDSTKSLGNQIHAFEERVMETPLLTSAPRSPFQRLETIKNRWKERNSKQMLKRDFDVITSSTYSKTIPNGKPSSKLRNEVYLDTQFAAAAIESQVEIPVSEDSNEAQLSPAVRALKRRKFSVENERRLSPSLSPSSISSHPGDGKTPSYRGDSHRFTFTTPEQQISSLLPDSYGLSRSSQSTTSSLERAPSSPSDFRIPATAACYSSQAASTQTSFPLIPASSPTAQRTVRLNGTSPAVELESSLCTGLWREARATVDADAKDASQWRGDEGPKKLVDGASPNLGKEAHASTSLQATPSQESIGIRHEEPKTGDRSPLPDSEDAVAMCVHNPSSPPPEATKPSNPNTAQEQTHPLHRLRSLPHTIDPGPPETDSLDWRLRPTHVTAALSSISHRSTSQLLSKYRPTCQTRALEAWERGYWTFDTGGWAADIQVSFWEYLVDFVGAGRAGYATRVEREGGGDVESGERASGLGTVKVWCFGDEVKHIYLLLYAASLYRIRKCGAEWRAWNGEVVVSMSGPSPERER